MASEGLSPAPLDRSLWSFHPGTFCFSFVNSLVAEHLVVTVLCPRHGSVAGQTLLQPVKLSITMAASPASLTGEQFTHWLVVFWLPRPPELTGLGLIRWKGECEDVWGYCCYGNRAELGTALPPISTAASVVGM